MGLFERFPYSDFHRLNLSWIVKKLKVMDTKLDELVSDHDAVVDLQSRMTTAEGNITSLSGRMTTAETKLGKIPLPTAGDVGKVLGAVADGAGAKLSYVTDQTGGDVPTPAAGDNGKVLTAGSGGTYSWETAPGANVPTPGGSDSGKVLTAGSGGSMSWQTANTGNDVPTPGSGDNGKVLTAGSGGTYSWQTAGGGSSLTLAAYRAANFQAGGSTGGVLDFGSSSTDFTPAQQSAMQAELIAARDLGAQALFDYIEQHIHAYVNGHRLMWQGSDPLPTGMSGASMRGSFLWPVNVQNTLTTVVYVPSFEISFNSSNFLTFSNLNCYQLGSASSISISDLSGADPDVRVSVAIYT